MRLRFAEVSLPLSTLNARFCMNEIFSVLHPIALY